MKILLCLVLGLVLGASSALAEPSKFQQIDALDAKLQNREALNLLLPLEKEQPKNSEVLLRIARQYCLLMTDASSKAEKQGLGELALTYAQRAVALEPQNAKAHLAVAVAYGRLAKQADNRTKLAYSKQVKEHADKALALDPNDDTTHYVLGAWHLELAGLSALSRSMAKLIYGSVPAASYEQAAEQLQKAVRLNPKRLASRVELGRAYAGQGKKEEARRELNTALAMPLVEKDDVNAKKRASKVLGEL